MATALSDLLTAKTPDVREAQLLAALNAAGFPTTDWYPGAVPRSIVKMITAGLADFDDLVTQIASSGLLGPVTVNGVSFPTRDWLEFLALDIYGVIAAPATKARQRIALWHLPGTGPSEIATVGQLSARSRGGRFYTNVTTTTVPAGTVTPSKVYLDFQAELAGAAYNNDGAGMIAELVTPLPGLAISNQALPFGGVDAGGRAAHVGIGTGTVTPRETTAGNPTTPPRIFVITILTSGQVGAAVASVVVKDARNSTTLPLSPIPSSLNAGDGVSIDFANGAQSPSFLAGEIFTFETGATPIINPGSDEESSASIRARCRGRWPGLSSVPTDDRYVGWVRQCSIDSGYGITKITAEASVIVAGMVDVVVASAVGGVPGGVVAALQAYVAARAGRFDPANVISASERRIIPGGIVTIRRADAAVTKAAAALNWQQYLADLPIGGERRSGGAVVLAKLEEAIMDAGAEDTSGLTLNGVAANLALAASEVAVTDSLEASLIWLEVGP